MKKANIYHWIKTILKNILLGKNEINLDIFDKKSSEIVAWKGWLKEKFNFNLPGIVGRKNIWLISCLFVLSHWKMNTFQMSVKSTKIGVQLDLKKQSRIFRATLLTNSSCGQL